MVVFGMIVCLIAVLFTAYSLIVSYFLRFAILPFQKKENDYVGNDEKKPEVVEAYHWLHENDYEVMNITSFDGLKLVGHYFPASEAKRTILFFHGWHGSWDGDFAPFAKWCHEEGSNLLMVEQRGQNQSEGPCMGMGIFERKDVVSWLTWYQTNKQAAQPDIPVYLMGISMGCATVLMSLGEKFPIPVTGVIADCGFRTPYEMFSDFAKRTYHLPEFPFLTGLTRYCKKKYGLDLKSFATTDALQNNEIPIFFVHGASDHFVLPQYTKANFEATKGYKEILLVENAEHCMSYLIDKPAYQAGVKRLWALKENADACMS